jgi:hypothetical protein
MGFPHGASWEGVVVAQELLVVPVLDYIMVRGIMARLRMHADLEYLILSSFSS